MVSDKNSPGSNINIGLLNQTCFFPVYALFMLKYGHNDIHC